MDSIRQLADAFEKCEAEKFMENYKTLFRKYKLDDFIIYQNRSLTKKYAYIIVPESHTFNKKDIVMFDRGMEFTLEKFSFNDKVNAKTIKNLYIIGSRSMVTNTTIIAAVRYIKKFEVDDGN